MENGSPLCKFSIVSAQRTAHSRSHKDNQECGLSFDDVDDVAGDL